MNSDKKKLTRTEKIDLLYQIKYGCKDIDALQPSITYNVFYGISSDNKYIVSEMRQNPVPIKFLNQQEFDDWERKIDKLNINRAIPHVINLIIFEIKTEDPVSVVS